MAKAKAKAEQETKGPTGSVSIGLGLKPSVNFNGYGFNVTITRNIEPGETMAQAVDRTYQDCEDAVKQYADHSMTLIDGYMQRLKKQSRGGR